MKSFKKFFWLAGTFFLFFSCKKEKSVEGGSGSGASTQWEFKDSALVFDGKMDTAYIQTAGSISSIILEGTSTDGTSDFYLEIFGSNISQGTYKSPNVQFAYVVRGTVVYESVPANTDKFSVVITSIDANGIIGTFSGEVEDALGNTKKITGGTFVGKFNSTTPPPPPAGNGQLLLWSKQGCGVAGSIAVKVQGQTGTITVFHTTAPACGAAGAATFSLAAGVYSWEAYCNLDTVRGSVTITSGNCSKAEVVLGAVVSTNCVISNLGYYDISTSTALGSLSSFFNASNQVNSVLFVDSATRTSLYTFSPNRSGNRINIDATQYFDLDASGRIKEFHGLVDAIEVALPRVVVVYTFNAGGYLEKAAYAFEAAPNVNILNINYTWTAGNLSKAVVQEPAKTERIEYKYTYDLSKPAKNFLNFYPNNEIILLQSAINYGNNSSHILTASTIEQFDTAGASIGVLPATYSNYTIDANNYVKQFSIVGDGSVYDGDTKYVLSYKCF